MRPRPSDDPVTGTRAIGPPFLSTVVQSSIADLSCG